MHRIQLRLSGHARCITSVVPKADIQLKDFKVANEPILGYLPGSKERGELEAALKRMKKGLKPSLYSVKRGGFYGEPKESENEELLKEEAHLVCWEAANATRAPTEEPGRVGVSAQEDSRSPPRRRSCGSAASVAGSDGTAAEPSAARRHPSRTPERSSRPWSSARACAG